MAIIRDQELIAAGVFFAILPQFQPALARKNFWLAVEFLTGLLEWLVWLELDFLELRLLLDLNRQFRYYFQLRHLPSSLLWQFQFFLKPKNPAFYLRAFQLPQILIAAWLPNYSCEEFPDRKCSPLYTCFQLASFQTSPLLSGGSNIVPSQFRQFLAYQNCPPDKISGINAEYLRLECQCRYLLHLQKSVYRHR